MLSPSIWREVYERLRSPHGERYAAEITELNDRYPADYVWLDGRRQYSDALPHPSESEMADYHDFGHLWTPEALADFTPRYQTYLAAESAKPAQPVPPADVVRVQTFIFKFPSENAPE